MANDFYDTLGIPRTASEAEIKQAYRKLSRELHPDKHKGDKQKEEKFKKVNEAYEVLSDPQKKAQYDRFGSSGPSGFGGQGGFNGFQGFSDFDASQFGGFGDIFESFFGGRGGGQRRQADSGGRDIELEITVPFTVAVSGTQQDVSFKTFMACDDCGGSGAQKGSTMITCTDCGGTGQIMRTVSSVFGTIQQATLCPKCKGSGKVPEKACKTCDGEGRVQKTKTVKLHIPPGIDEGQTLRVTGEGEAGRRGSKSGNLFVHVHVKSDARFGRNQDDIHATAVISLVDAVLGTEMDVPTVHGDMTMKVPAGTQPGSVLRIKGKGMPVLNTSRHGDHYVTVNVEVPEKLSKKERELFEELRKSE